MSDLFASSVILLGNLPAPVRQGLVRALTAVPLLRVVPGPTEPGQLAGMATRYCPTLVIVGEADLPELAALARFQTVPVLLYCEVPPLSSRMRILARWNVQDYFGPAAAGSAAAVATWQAEVVRKIRATTAAAAAPVLPAIVTMPTAQPGSVVVLGGSTGGSAAVESVLRGVLSAITCTILVAVHLPRHFTQALVERLQRATTLPVVAGETGLLLAPGQVIVAPGGYHMTVAAAPTTPWVRWQVTCTPTQDADLSADSPSVDLLMESAARTTGQPVLGVVLSGLGHDGTAGARAIRRQGGTVVVQDYASAAVYSMPESVTKAGEVDAILPLAEIGAYINRFARQSPHQRISSPQALRA